MLVPLILPPSEMPLARHGLLAPAPDTGDGWLCPCFASIDLVITLFSTSFCSRLLLPEEPEAKGSDYRYLCFMIRTFSCHITKFALWLFYSYLTCIQWKPHLKRQTQGKVGDFSTLSTKCVLWLRRTIRLPSEKHFRGWKRLWWGLH